MPPTVNVAEWLPFAQCGQQFLRGEGDGPSWWSPPIWTVRHVDDGEDLAAVDRALAAAKAETGRPSMIVLRTIIGWPSPTSQNTGAAQGSVLGEDEVRATGDILGFDPDHYSPSGTPAHRWLGGDARWAGAGD
ncbi:MAG: hypothetical protein JOZ47_05430 [Kutzneria sp.]|nr:hypothetical protein [Kutzneria sp.]